MKDHAVSVRPANRLRETASPVSFDAGQIDINSVLSSLAEGVIVADGTGKFIYFNQAAKDILGIGIQDVSSREWSAAYGVYHPDGRKPFPSDRLPLARALKGEEVFGEILYIKNPQRPEGVHINLSARPIRDSEGRIAGGTVIFRDISGSMKAIQAQKRSEARVKTQFNGIPIPTYVWQRREDDFVLVDYNHAASVFSQGLLENFLDRKYGEIYADEPEAIEDIWKCYRGKSTVRREKFAKMRTIGEWRDLVVDHIYLAPDMVLVHIQDVTEQKKAEKQLRQLSNAVEQTADSVIITDREGLIEYVNPAFEETTGFSRREAIGKSPGILRSGKHDSSFYQEIWRTILAGKPFRGTIINKKKSGELYWSEQTITPMKDDRGEIRQFVSVLKDITTLREKQEQEFQMRIARAVQQRLFKADMAVAGCDIAGMTLPAVETSGDYFDFIPFPDGSLGIVIFDVVGHGIGSALTMAGTRAYLHAFVKYENDPGTLLTLLNRELASDLDDEQFVTMTLVRLCPERSTLHYASAGHGQTYQLDDGGALLKELESTGIPLGILADHSYQTSEAVRLSRGDILLFLTDGILEAESAVHGPFGLQRTLKQVKKHRGKSSRTILESLVGEVRRFCDSEPQADDLSAIVCKINALQK
jgi:PAS domain S-box-containing protein